jgi:phytol kinase
MLVGSFVAFWPFFIEWNDIRLLSLAFAAVVFVSTRVKVFQSIRAIRRLSYGEMFFALSVGFLTIITESKGIYAAAILQMALADGMAAIVGTRFGRRNAYLVLGHTKSVAGTATFSIISLILLSGYAVFSDAGLAWQHVALGAAGAATLENLGIYGLDNLLVPAYVGLLLTQLA